MQSGGVAGWDTWNRMRDRARCFSVQSASREPNVPNGKFCLMIYDQLGFICPFVLKAKQLLREICRIKQPWDSELPGHLAEIWENWTSELDLLQMFNIPRCYKAKWFGVIKDVIDSTSFRYRSGGIWPVFLPSPRERTMIKFIVHWSWEWVDEFL